MALEGSIRKLQSTLEDPIQYDLIVGDDSIRLNDCLGKKITIQYLDKIECIYCGRSTKKSYSQGYCFPCSQKLARCDFCIVKPETCHYHLGTCREPQWGLAHCFQPHVVYLANTSEIKVGMTRKSQVPTRWIDQGAIQALPILEVQSRLEAGVVEVSLKKYVKDRTDWRKMIQNQSPVDLRAFRDDLAERLQKEFIEESVRDLQYPLLRLPEKIQSLSIEKQKNLSGTLLGVKGQYLIWDMGVLNIRKLSGYCLSVKID